MEGKEIIRVDREGKSFSVRGEVRPSRPLGYCTFASKVAMKGLQYRTIEKSK